jgi:hypothetical protein
VTLNASALIKSSIAGLSLGTFVLGVEMHDYLVIAAGLVIGLFARWAVMQSIGQAVTWRVIRIDAMIVVMNGLFASQFGETFALHGTKLAVSAAMFGASSTIVFSKLHAKFLDVSDKSPTSMFIGAGSKVKIPAGAEDVCVHTTGPDSPTTPAEVQRQHYLSAPIPEPDPEMQALLEKLDAVPPTPPRKPRK